MDESADTHTHTQRSGESFSLNHPQLTQEGNIWSNISTSLLFLRSLTPSVVQLRKRNPVCLPTWTEMERQHVKPQLGLCDSKSFSRHLSSPPLAFSPRHICFYLPELLTLSARLRLASLSEASSIRRRRAQQKSRWETKGDRGCGEEVWGGGSWGVTWAGGPR